MVGATPSSFGQELFVLVSASKKGKLCDPEEMRCFRKNEVSWTRCVSIQSPRGKFAANLESGLCRPAEAAVALNSWSLPRNVRNYNQPQE